MTSSSDRGTRTWVWVEVASLALLIIGAVLLRRSPSGWVYNVGGGMALVGLLGAAVALLVVCVRVALNRWRARSPRPASGGPRLVRSKAAYRLDSGVGPILLGVGFLILGVVVKVGAAATLGSFVGWWVLVCGLAMGLVGIVIGTRRRKAFRVNHGVRQNPNRVDVPVEPFEYISQPSHPGFFLREPAVMMVFSAFFLGITIGLVADPHIRSTGGAALVVVVLIFGACFLTLLYMGLRRLFWFRAFKRITGNTPW